MNLHHVVLSITALALSTSLAFAQGNTAFSYQGRLLDSGEPAGGTFNVDFSLWDDPAAGNQVGSTNTFNSLPILEGLFTIELDFGASAFDNNDRWLKITVDGVPLVPRQPITRAPYSIQTRGIFVDDAGKIGIGTSTPDHPFHVESFGDIAIYARDNATSGTTFGGRFESDSTSGRGVQGQATATSGANHGGWFSSNSTSGRGVHGLANATSGINYGVVGTTYSPDGYAGYFYGGRNFFQGDVGIGDFDPDATLHVCSAGGAPQILIEQTDAGDFARLRWRVAEFPEWTVSSEPAAEPEMRWFNNTNGNVMVLDFDGDLQIDGALTQGSDRNRKENIEPVDRRQILEKVAKLPINRWSYKSDSAGTRHIGPMAQDFHARFEVGKDEKHIGSLDASGIALAAIQALHELVGELRDEKRTAVEQLRSERNAEIEQLRSAHKREMKSLRAENEALVQKFTKLELLVLRLQADNN